MGSGNGAVKTPEPVTGRAAMSARLVWRPLDGNNTAVYSEPKQGLESKHSVAPGCDVTNMRHVSEFARYWCRE